MNPRDLPPWEGDPLSKLLAESQYNERAISLKYPDIFQILQSFNDTFIKLQQAIQQDDEIEKVIPRLLLMKGYSGCIAAMRLAMSGQLPESSAILRVAIESAWYALHLALDPAPPNRRNIWLSISENEKKSRVCANEFSIKNVRDTHYSQAPKTAQTLRRLYKALIESGGHPNDVSVFGMTKVADVSKTNLKFEFGILNPKPMLISIGLKHVVAVGIGILSIAQLILPKRCRSVNLQEDIAALVKALNTVFKQPQDKD